MVKNLNAFDLAQSISTPERVLLDVRPSAAFNGWKLDGESRGGRLPGARNLSLAWLGRMGKRELLALLQVKGIRPEREIVLYGYRSEACRVMAHTLAGLGFERLGIYAAGFKEWAAQPELPLEVLPNFEKLVHPAWLAKNLRAREDRAEMDQKVMLIEAGSAGPSSYLQGHLPGAFYLNLNQFEHPPGWNLVPAPELERGLLSMGITRDRTIVLYSREDFAAARLALTLMYAGVSDVRLLDGGLPAWLASGGALETSYREPAPAAAFGPKFPARPELIIDYPAASRLAAGKNGRLVCVRDWEEYTGQVSGYDYITARGRIPGSLWGGSIQSSQFTNPDGTMRDFQEIAAFWQARGLDPAQKIAFYCGTGWRASLACFYAYLMDWKNVSIYDGGWLEWSAQPDRPIETGVTD